MAATGVRAMLNNILTDSAKTEKGFAQLARITGDTTITMKNFRAEMKEKGMVQAMVDLSDAATRAGDEGTEALGKIFPNIRALTQALFVFKTNGGMVIDMMKEMRNGEDDLGNGTRELQKTWDWQWAQMKVSIEKLWISLGEKLMPIFKGLLDAMKAGISVFQWFVNVFNAMPLSLQAIVISFTALLTVLGPTLIVLGQLAMAVGNLMRGAVALQAMAGAAGLLGKSLMFLGGYWQWIIAGLVALGTVVIWYTQRTKVSIETINESTATNARHLESLKKIEKQLESSIVEHGTYADVLKRVNTAGSSLNFVMEETEKVQKRALDGSYGVRNGLISEAEAVQKNVDLQKDYHTIAAQIIQLNPATIGALTKERLAQQDLTKAINDTNSAKLQSEKIANDLRAKEIVNLKSLANEQQNTMTEALRVINTGTKYTTIRGGTIISSGVSTSEIDNAKTQYKLAEAALKEYNKQIDDNNTKFNETRESYDANFKALEDLRRSTEANAAAANNHTNTLTGQALAAQALSERVDNLTSSQRAAIDFWNSKGYAGKNIFAEMKVEVDKIKSQGGTKNLDLVDNLDVATIDQYIKSQKSLKTQFKETVKEQTIATEAGFALDRVNQLLIASGIDLISVQTLENEEWAKLALRAGASIEDIEKAIGDDPKVITFLKMWQKEIQATAKVDADFAKDYVTNANAMIQLMARSEALQDQLEGDSLAVRYGRITQWENRQIASLNKLTLGWKDYIFRLNAIYLVGAQERDAVDARMLIEHEEVMEKLKNIDIKYLADIEVEWDKYASVIFKSFDNIGITQVKKIEADFTKAEAANRSQLSKRLAQIKEDANNSKISWQEAGMAAAVAIHQTREMTRALTAVSEAQKFDIMVSTMVKGLDVISQKLGSVAETAIRAWKIITNDEKKDEIDPNTGQPTGRRVPVVSTSDKVVAGLSAASSIANQLITSNSRSASAVKGALSMAASGAALGTMIMPGIGTAIGAVAGGIAGLVSGWNSAGTAARDANRKADVELTSLRNNLIITYGSMANIDKIGKQIGVDLVGAWKDTTVAGLEHFSKLIDAFQKMESLMESSKPKWERIGAIMEKYGISLSKAGAAIQQLKSNSDALVFMNDWQDYVAIAGENIDVLIQGMSKQVSKFVADAIRLGLTIPANMKPIIEAMDRAGKLLDGTGKPIDITTIIYGPVIQTAMEKNTAAIEQLTKQIRILNGEVMNPDGTFGPIKVEGGGGGGGGGEGEGGGGGREQSVGNREQSVGGIGWTNSPLYGGVSSGGNDSSGFGGGDFLKRLGSALLHLGTLGSFGSSWEDSDKSRAGVDLSSGLPFAGGSGGLRDFGIATPAVLHGIEAVLTAQEYIALLSRSSQVGGGENLGLGLNENNGVGRLIGPQNDRIQGTTNITIQAWDGASVDEWLRTGGARKVTEAIAPELPGVVRRYGLTK